MKKSLPFSSPAKRLALFFPGLLLLSLLISACQTPPASAPITESSFHFDTLVTVTIYDSKDKSLLTDCMELCDYYENIFSRTLEYAELAQLNEAAKKEENAGQALPLSDDLAALLEKGLEYSRLSEGAFDITLEPVSSLWDFSSGQASVPSGSSIREALPNVGYEKVQTDSRSGISSQNSALSTSPENTAAGGHTVSFQQAGMGLDLGAVAKGYIADRLRDYLVSRGVKSATINLGGNLICIGNKPDGSPFKIGIQKPFSDRSDTIAYMDITDMSVVTSGIYERCFEADGHFYHHLLNPKTGYPYENRLVSVTIVCEKSVDGDGLSTTCFALGLEEGLALLNSLANVHGIFITEDSEIYYTEGFEEAFSLREIP